MGDLEAELQKTEYLQLKRAESQLVELARKAEIQFRADLKAGRNPLPAKQVMETHVANAATVREYARWQLTAGALRVVIGRAHRNSSRRAYLEEQLSEHEKLKPEGGPILAAQVGLFMPPIGADEELPRVETMLPDQAFLALTTAARYAEADADLRQPWLLLGDYTLDLVDHYTSARFDEQLAVRAAADAGPERGKEERVAEARAAVRKGWDELRSELAAEFADSVAGMAVTFPETGDGMEAHFAPSVDHWFHNVGLHEDHAAEVVNLRTFTQLQNRKSAEAVLDGAAGGAAAPEWDTGIKNRDGARLLEEFMVNVAAADHYRALAQEAAESGRAARAAGRDSSTFDAAAQDNKGKFVKVSDYARHRYEEQGLDLEIRLSSSGGVRRANLVGARAAVAERFTDALREGKELAAQAPRYEGRRTVSADLVQHQEVWLLATVTAARFGNDPKYARYVESWRKLGRKTLTLLNREAVRDVMVGRSGPRQPTAQMIESETAHVDNLRSKVELQMAKVTEVSPLVVPLSLPEQPGGSVSKLPEDAVHRVLATSGALDARRLGDLLAASHAHAPGTGLSGVSDPYAPQIREAGRAPRHGSDGQRQRRSRTLSPAELRERYTVRMIQRLKGEGIGS